MSFLALLFTATGILCAGFALLYFVARAVNNYGIVDVAWSYAFAALAAFYAVGASGWPVRRALIATMVCLWSIRLGTHLLRRVAGHHPVEDGRYRQLRKDWAGNFPSKMFGFFQLQALSIIGLGIPFVLIAQNSHAQVHPFEIAGVILWLVALTGETVADRQLKAFSRNAAHRGQVCQVGLWRSSRHPNYFFEWLTWVAFFVFALASPWGWLAVISPLSILFLLLRVTGIPMTEKQSIRSRGDAYLRYQQTTSAFVPWIRKPPTP